jgi:PAS domain S-box-containing protein
VSASDRGRKDRDELHTLFETLPVGVVYQDAAGRIVELNPAAERMLGGTLEELLARTSDDERWRAVRPDGSPLPGSEHPAMVALRTGEEVRGVLLGIWNPVLGEQRFLRVDAVPLFRPGEPAPYQAYASFRDETELHRATAALRESEERFRSIVEASPMGIHLYRLEPDGRLVFLGANPAADAILGVPNAQFVGKEILEAFPPLAATEVPERYREIAERGGSWKTEQVDYQDQQIRGAYEVHAFRYAPRHVGALFLDITERKRADAALLESRTRLEVMIEGAELGTFEWDVATDVTVVDERVAAFFGYPLEELIGKGQADWARIIHPEDLPQARAALEAHLAGRAPSVISECRVQRKSGDWIWVQLRAKIVERDAEGRPRRLVGVHADITARKRAEEERASLQVQLLQAQKMESLGVLAGGIAHDFNNLLCGVLGSAELAMLDVPSGHPAVESLEQIRSSSQRATELCRQLLAYAGKGRFVVEPVDLSAVVEGMAQLISVSISKKIVLRYNLEQGLPAVEADATQIRQVVLNLLVNAAEAIGDRSGAITLSTGAMECDREYLQTAYIDQALPVGCYVYLEVADTGCGMNEETRHRLFDPFFSTKFTGRGLGLAATLGIVRGHRGTVKVYSEVGKGTTIKVLFPACDREAIQASRENTAETWRGRGTVLLVDDEETVRSVGKRMLERLGLEVLLARDGREGIELYRSARERIDLVILDLTMPHMNGEEVFRELRVLRPDVRVILMSGYNEQEVTSRFVGKGLAGFVQKPLQLATFSAILRRTLEQEGE